MRIGILGCDAIRNEIEIITAGDPEVVYREYLEFGLHLRPDSLKKIILEKIESLPIEVDVLFLGYGHCQSLEGLPKQVKLPLVMLEHEDCIAAILTTERYHAEKHKGGITWFYPTGWAKYGILGIIKLFELDHINSEEYTSEYFLKFMFDGFSRCLLIDNNVNCVEECQKTSEQFAETLGLRHECVKGSIELIRDAWLKTKAKAADIERANFR